MTTRTKAQILAEARRLIARDGNRMTVERDALAEELFVASLKETRVRLDSKTCARNRQARKPRNI